jgi:hypothetical protein
MGINATRPLQFVKAKTRYGAEEIGDGVDFFQFGLGNFQRGAMYIRIEHISSVE